MIATGPSTMALTEAVGELRRGGSKADDAAQVVVTAVRGSVPVDPADARLASSRVMRRLAASAGLGDVLAGVEVGLESSALRGKLTLGVRRRLLEAGAVDALECIADGVLRDLQTCWDSCEADELAPFARELHLHHSVAHVALVSRPGKEGGSLAIASSLGRNTTLSSLVVDGRLSEELAAALAEGFRGNCALTELCLDIVVFHDASVRALARGLLACQGLTTLNLFVKGLGAAGAVALCEAVRDSSSITELRVNLPELGDAGMAALGDVLALAPRLRRVEVHWFGTEGRTSRELVTRLAWSRTLASMTITDVGPDGPTVTAEAVSALAVALRSSTSLREVDVSTIPMTEESAVELAVALATNTRLTSVYPARVGLSGAALGHVVDMVGASTALRVLHLRSARHLGSAGCHAVLSSLRHNGGLKELGLVGVGMKEASAADLAPALGAAGRLRLLDLSRNWFGDAGLEAVGAGLRVNSCLTSLKLAGVGGSAVGARHVATAVGENSTLTKLTLDGNAIGVDGANAVAGMLEVNRTLKSLSLRQCRLGDEGVSMVGDALVVNSTLKLLDLAFNRFSSDGAEVLLNGLCQNRGLTSLSLWPWKVDPRGVGALVGMLRENSTLVRLDLGPATFSSAALAALADAAKEHNQLQQLGMNGGQEFCECRIALQTALDQSHQKAVMWGRRRQLVQWRSSRVPWWCE